MREMKMLTFVAAMGLGMAIAAAATIPNKDWPTQNRDLAGTRYSPLTQINTKNVQTLKQVWTFRLRTDDRAPFQASEAVPIVVNGVMYLSAGTRVVALEPETGKEIWRYVSTGTPPSRRGVAYWPGDRSHAPRIIVTLGRRLVALNAKTGNAETEFGNNGEVDLVVPYNSPVTIYKNVLMVGADMGDSPALGTPGDARAFDARTGAKLWEFHSVPRPGEVGHETWLDDGWKDRSGVNVWGWYLTLDEKTGTVYMPFGSPAGNYWGGDRPGNNLFGNSVVAVDALTGKYKWHFQAVHHDLWDSDMPPAPVMVDIKQNGKTIPALAAITKQAWMFILNRETGKPIFGVEERPVPTGDAPGEWYSPTQPFPLKPPPLARISFKKEDLVTAEDTTPEHAKACLEIYEKAGGFYN